MDNKRKITLGVIIALILLLFYSCSTRFGFFGNKNDTNNKTEIVSNKENSNKESKKEEKTENKKETVKEEKKDNKDDNKEKASQNDSVESFSSNVSKGEYSGKLHPDYFKNNGYVSTYCPIKNSIDKKIEGEKIKEIENKDNNDNKNNGEKVDKEISKVPSDAPTVELPTAEIEKVPSDAPIVELPTAEIEKVPNDAPTVDLPIAEIEKVPNDAPTIELEKYDDTFEKKLSIFENKFLGMKDGDYSKASFENFKNILEQAKKYKYSAVVSPEEKARILLEVERAYDGLTVDKKALQEQIKFAEEIVKKREDYTEESYNEFLAIFENAKTVNNLSTATQSEVDTETEELKEAIKSLVKKPKDKPELTVVEVVEDEKAKTATIKYNLVDESSTFVSAKAKLYKDTELVKEVEIKNNQAIFDNLELNVEYRIETELKYNDGTVKTEILEDKRNFTLENEVKKVELKNIENISVLKKDGDKFIAISNLSSVPNDLENYFVKFKSSTMIESLFRVEKIVEDGGKFKVIANAPELVQYNGAKKDYDDKHTVLLDKKSTEQGVYTSFKDLVEAIKKNPSGNFVLGADVSADEIELINGENSYISDTFMGTLKAEKDGKIFSISGLKAPLFNNLGNSTIEKINLVDVNINSSVNRVGALAKTANIDNENISVNISNVNVQGNISAPNDIGGLVAVANKTVFKNVTFSGNINMTSPASNSVTGGIVGSINGGEISNVSVVGDMNVISNSNNNKAGMIVGHAQNINITNVYAGGNLVNSKDAGQVAGLVGSMWRNGTLTKAISEVDSINAVKIHGDRGFVNAIKDNVYVLENKDGIADNTDKVKTVDKNKINELITEYNIPKFARENKFSNSFIDYSVLDEYSADRKIAYENMEKIIPLYNRDYILKQGNKIQTNSNLYNKKVLSVVPMADDEVVVNIGTNKENINKLMVHYADNTVEYLDLKYKEDFKNVIAEYSIVGTDLIYTPNQYITDYSSLVNSVKDEFKNIEYFSDEVFNTLNYVPSDPSKAEERDVVIDKLYLKHSFENVKEHIDSILTALISNSNVFGSTDGVNNEYIKKYLSENKVNILLGLSYLQKWYNIDFGTVNIKDLVMFRQDFFGENVNELEWIANVGKLGFNSLNPVNNFKTYPSLLSSNTGENNLLSYLEKNREIFVPNKSNNDWFKESTKAYITERKSSERPDVNVEIYNTLKADKYQNMILPLLTLSEKNVYIIKNFSTVSFGSFERYVDMELKNTNPELFKEKVAELKDKIEKVADAHKEHFDFWYRVAPQNTREQLINDLPNWDANYKYSENGNYRYNSGLWYPAYGDTSKSIYEFFGAVGRWHGNLKDDREAYANGSQTWFVSLGLLDGYAGNSVFSHEMTHNYDGGIYFGGYGRRDGFGGEAFARGMFEAPRGANNWDFGLNTISDFRDSKNNSVHNTHPTRFLNSGDLQEYMSGIFDVIYTLDYAEAMSLVKKSPEEQSQVLRQIKHKDDFTDYSEEVTAEIAQNLNLQTIDDFVDNNIAVRGYYAHQTLGLNNRNTYNIASLFNPFYGILENPNGSSGGHTFKRTAFELLGAKGYEDGMLGYISNKYKKDAQAEGATFGDAYILNKIFNGQYATFAEFKKAQFKKRIDRISNLKPITITFKNQQYVIDNFEKLQELMDNATTMDIELRKNGRYQFANNVTDLKSAIYKEYFKLTDEFRTSIYN